jgi:hypothetical protein
MHGRCLPTASSTRCRASRIDVPPLPATGSLPTSWSRASTSRLGSGARAHPERSGAIRLRRRRGAPVFDAAGGAGYVPTRSACASASSTSARAGSPTSPPASRAKALWRASVAADELEGYIEYRPARAAPPAPGACSRLARLSLPKGEAERVESLLDSQPASIPALDVVVDDFELRGKHRPARDRGHLTGPSPIETARANGSWPSST